MDNIMAETILPRKQPTLSKTWCKRLYIYTLKKRKEASQGFQGSDITAQADAFIFEHVPKSDIGSTCDSTYKYN